MDLTLLLYAPPKLARGAVRLGRALSLIACLSLASAARSQSPDTKTPIPPTRVSLPKQETTLGELVVKVGDLTKFAIDVAGADPKRKLTVECENMPFWEALEAIAAQADCRIAIGPNDSPRGKRIQLVPAGKTFGRAWVDGPFRIRAREIRIRHDLDTAEPHYDVILEVRWEPRFEVLRASAEPAITRAVDDTGRPLANKPASVLAATTEYTTDFVIALTGLSRESKAIAVLEGEFTVTAAPAMLSFAFDLTVNKPVTVEHEGVKVTLHPLKKDEKLWAVPLVLTYPPEGPVFESHEEALRVRANTLTLTGPDHKSYPIKRGDSNGLALTYRFEEGQEVGSVPNGLKGWKLEYRTPAPLREYLVRFRLKDIPLP